MIDPSIQHSKSQPEPGAVLTVPLFPLPSIVMFPRIKLPLYIFEPRYRALLTHALDGDGLVGIPLLLPGFERNYAGSPEVTNVFGVGTIEDYETHDDGTSNIEILGRWRVRTLEELESSPFRMARVEVLADVVPDAEVSAQLHRHLRDALDGLERLGVRPEAKEALQRVFRDGASDVAFLVHMLTTVIVGNPGVRQKILEENCLAARARHLVTIIETLRQELERPSGRPEPEAED